MGRRVAETVYTATNTSSADNAAQGAGGARKGGEAVEEAHRRVHTELEEREPENSAIHADEERVRRRGDHGLRHITGQATSRSDTMKATTPQSSAPTQAAEIEMECEGVRQARETDETRHQSHKINTRATNQRWRKREVRKIDGSKGTVRGGHPRPHRRGGLDYCTTHQAQGSKKPKMERRGSPTGKSRSRVRSVMKKSVVCRIAPINITKMAEIYKVGTINNNGMSAGG